MEELYNGCMGNDFTISTFVLKAVHGKYLDTRVWRDCAIEIQSTRDVLVRLKLEHDGFNLLDFFYGVAVRLFASHLDEPGSIPVFSVMPRFSRRFIPALLDSHFVSPSSALETFDVKSCLNLFTHSLFQGFHLAPFRGDDVALSLQSRWKTCRRVTAVLRKRAYLLHTALRYSAFRRRHAMFFSAPSLIGFVCNYLKRSTKTTNGNVTIPKLRIAAESAVLDETDIATGRMNFSWRARSRRLYRVFRNKGTGRPSLTAPEDIVSQAIPVGVDLCICLRDGKGISSVTPI
ncbi:hypothetical protein PR048_029037 [Dryococelus australis]|uniref:Maturase K n=1 Tax=Dryococelus australis TaxID=614101 RepID=A0ABQ9GES3_9NEOP|nr:hypothetical protein PR048_029037 [Dryococelus australis]